MCKAARYSGIGTPLAGSRALRMYRYVRLILMSLRYNLPQALPAAMASVSQLPRHLGLGTRLARALSASVSVVEDLELTAQLAVDDTLLPCWSWRRRPGT